MPRTQQEFLSGNEQFEEELRAEAQSLNTFSTIKLNASLSVGGDRVHRALMKLLLGIGFSSDWEPSLALVHECTHYWHWIGTTLGFHSTRLTMAQSALTGMAIQMLDKAGLETFPVPLRSIPMAAVPEQVKANLQCVTHWWNSIERYKVALHGYVSNLPFSPEEFAKNVLPTALTALMRFDCAYRQFGSESATDYALAENMLDRYAFNVTPTTEITPIIYGHSDTDYRLAGRAVLEGAAVCQEFKMLTQMRQLGVVSETDFLNRVDTINNSFYGTTLKVFCGRLQATSWSAIRTLPYLLDLAMMGLLDTLYLRPFSDRIAWYDMNPGWRFLRILEAVRETSLPPEDAPADAYIELVLRICKKEAWPTPADLAVSSKRFQPTQVSYMAGAGFYNQDPFFEFGRRHCAAMEARLTGPHLFINTAEHFGTLFGRDLSYHLLRPTILMSDDQAYSDTEMLGFYMIHQIMREIFIGSIDRLQSNAILPKGLRPQFRSQKDGSVFEDNLFESLVWERVGFSRERFVAAAKS